MKTIPLLPKYFRWIGLLFVIASLALYVNDALRDRSTNGGLFVETFVFIDDTPGNPPALFQLKEVDLLLTLILVTLLIGLSCIAFCKRKTEDEMINSIRLYSWSWSVILMIVFGVIVTIFVYGMTFVTFAFFFGHLLLLTYIGIFNLNIWKMNRRIVHEE
ncbi:hypothetical protein [Sphingobacterium ginsenosidimutans]|uniref:DUF4293 domain-containing protein n=1 Tax=Sphingobacterium ginsenosidimutans TaxID=687845 RepID=A0ABP7ZW05_9SPHI